MSLSLPPDPPGTAQPPNRLQALAAFKYLRSRLIRNHLGALFTHSRLRLFIILFCSMVFWTGLFAFFFEGFQFLGTFVKLSNELVEYLFSLFFLSLLTMLVFSTGIIVYTGLFSSREAAFLLTTPAGADRVFAYKFLEAMAFSSWAFLLLGSPMLIAYGLASVAPWPYYTLFFAYLVAFTILPGCLGAMAAILVAYLLPRRRRAALLWALALIGLAAVLLVNRLLHTPGEMLSRNWLDSLLSQLSFSLNPLLPSRWVARGLLSTARDNWQDGLFYLAVTAANAAFAYLLAALLARDLYRTAYSRVQGAPSARRARGRYSSDSLFHRLFFFLKPPVRLLILKDLRTFKRDPAQWSQFLIFFGLLAFYFFNIRRLGYHVQHPYFRYLLSFLNLAVTALILSTFTSRFVFPMLSLEGRNFWILGLLPLKRSQILWGKFAFSLGISLFATEFLIMLSDAMLRVGPAMTAIHAITVVILCLGLSGISVGLGACMPNLREDDPSKIATGFGGTINLLVSLVFILLVLAALALPCQLYLANRELDDITQILPTQPWFQLWIAIGMLVAATFGLAAVVVPLRLGIRTFQNMEP